jgi:hypothetical protein
MRTGFEVFSRLAAIYPLYLQGESVLGHSVEVFPHASAVVLAGSLQPPGWSKSRWRRSVLAHRGIQDKGFQSIDLVDAALAALTGLEALDGTYCAVGDPREGVIVLPARQLPSGRYHAGPNAGIPVSGVGVRDASDQDGSNCECGCGVVVPRRYLPGHDAKHRSRLLRAARGGDAEAARDLQARGWA